MKQMTDGVPIVPKEEEGEPLDLAERLARYRARVEREGRKAAVERLDRAIDQARRPTPRR